MSTMRSIVVLAAALGLAGCFFGGPPPKAGQPFSALGAFNSPFPALPFSSLTAPLPPPPPAAPQPPTAPPAPEVPAAAQPPAAPARVAAQTPAAPGPLAPISAEWRFASSATACTAMAGGEGGGFGIDIGVGRPVVFTLSGARAAAAAGSRVAIQLDGPAGKRTLEGRAVAGKGIVAEVPAGETARAYVLAALGGGTAIAAGLPEIRMPPGGPAGASWWFDCARARAGS